MNQEEELRVARVKRYVKSFNYLIKCCGQVAYYWSMKNGVRFNSAKVEQIATTYQRNEEFYFDHQKQWRRKAFKAFFDLKKLARQLDICFDYSDEETRIFLNLLAINKDRRDSYKYYLNKGLKESEAYSPGQLEDLFVKRLEKRKK